MSLMMNNSIVQDLFINEFKSRMTCEECKNVKIMVERNNVIPVCLQNSSSEIIDLKE